MLLCGMGNSSNFKTYKIERLQRRAYKFILETDYTTFENARKHLHILSFEETMFIHKARIMCEIANSVAPIYITDLFQMIGSANNLNNICTQLKLLSISNKFFLIPKPYINLFKNSISYSGALVCNNIPLWIKTSSTIESFTNNCLKWMNCEAYLNHRSYSVNYNCIQCHC